MMIVVWVQPSAVVGSGVLAVRCGSAYFFLRGHKCVIKVRTIVCVGSGIEVKIQLLTCGAMWVKKSADLAFA